LIARVSHPTHPDSHGQQRKRGRGWLVRSGRRLSHPEVQAIPVIRADGSGLRVRSGGELSGEDVVPGFRCSVTALFPAARPAEADTGATVQEPSAS